MRRSNPKYRGESNNFHLSSSLPFDWLLNQLLIDQPPQALLAELREFLAVHKERRCLTNAEGLAILLVPMDLRTVTILPNGGVGLCQIESELRPWSMQRTEGVLLLR